MAWIKRNLYFVIGGLVALGFLGWAGYYNFAGWQHKTKVLGELSAKYEELKRVSQIKPNPGNKEVDNIALAQEQQQQIKDVISRAAGQFVAIPAIPPTTNVSSQEYAAALRQTVDQLQREALAASITFPARYSFSFEAQRGRVLFAPGSLDALATQLGEVRAIVSIINQAKVNALNAIRRERISADDATGPATDYTTYSSVTNDLAVITPYEITIQCFTPELASVLAGFASSSNGIVVKALNVDNSSSTTARTGDNGGGTDTPPEQPAMPKNSPAALNEKQIRVTMLLEVVKLLPRK